MDANGDPKWTVSQDERKHTSRIDGRKRYLFTRCRPVRTKACVWETGTSCVLRPFARVVNSAASCDNRASFRCDLVAVQWNSSRLFATDFFLASWKSWFLFKPAKLRVLSIWFSFLRCQSLGCFKPRNVVLSVWFRSRAIKGFARLKPRKRSSWLDYCGGLGLHVSFRIWRILASSLRGTNVSVFLLFLHLLFASRLILFRRLCCCNRSHSGKNG
jgi:hypothetical protein